MKTIEEYRHELHKVIEANNFDFSCEAVIKKSHEVEKKMFAIMKAENK